MAQDRENLLENASPVPMDGDSISLEHDQQTLGLPNNVNGMSSSAHIGGIHSKHQLFIMRLWAKSWFFYTILSLSAFTGGVMFGYDLGIISGVLIFLDLDEKYSCFQRELLVGSSLAGALCGTSFGGALLDCLGRRHTLLINTIIATLGIILSALAQGFIMLLLGRFIVGISLSLAVVGECLLVSELATPKHRGKLLSLNELGITLGMLLSNLMSFMFASHTHPWRCLFAFGLCPTFIMAVCLLLLPSSPRFLLMKGDSARAVEILKILRSQHWQAEMKAINLSIAHEQSHSIRDLFSTKDNFHIRMLVGVGLVLLQQLSGQPNILYYAPILLTGVGFSSVHSATLSTLAVGAVKFGFTVVVIVLVDRIGRRILLLLGAVGMSLSLVVMVVTDLVSKFPLVGKLCGTISSDLGLLETSNVTHYNLTTTHNMFASTISTVAMPQSEFSPISRTLVLLALMIYVAAYSVGFGSITWIILSEIYPSALRGRAMSLATMVNWITNLVISLSFLSVLNAVGVSVLFSLYLCVCLVAVVFIVTLVPETKGQSLEKISRQFEKGTFSFRGIFMWKRPPLAAVRHPQMRHPAFNFTTYSSRLNACTDESTENLLV